MRKVYLGLAGLMLAAVMVQWYLAAVGAFDKPQEDGSFALHSMNGMMIIPILSLLATVAAALSKAPGRAIGLTILPLGLIIVQVLIIALGNALNDSSGNTTPASLAVLGLHAINGMAIAMVSVMVFRQARRLAMGTAAGDTQSTAARAS